MPENELRKHLREGLAKTPVSLSSDELTKVVKHLENHDVVVSAPKAPEPKPEPKAAPKSEAKSKDTKEKK
jgi:hypothetical protein